MADNSASPVTPAAMPRQRILLVEDDAGVRRSVQLLLHGRGYDVRAYPAAAPLLTDAELGDAAFLIADFRLPDGDGLTLLRGMRARGWNGRALMITGYATPALTDAAMAGGYHAVLTKPVRPHELMQMLTGPATSHA